MPEQKLPQMDDNLIITSEDYNVMHKMYESLQAALKTPAVQIRVLMPRQMVIDWCKSYEKLTGFMTRGKLIRPT